MNRPDSRGSVGAKPEAWSCAAFGSLCQSSLTASTAWSDWRTSWMVGFMSGLVMPKAASEGPVATMATVLLVEPPMMKPPIMTLSPVRTSPRVEMLPRRVGLEVALKVAVTEAAAVIVIVQAPLPEQAPDQPAKVKPETAAAESVTLVPEAKEAEQALPQSMPAGDEVTVPEPESATERVNWPGALTVWVTVLEVAVS